MENKTRNVINGILITLVIILISFMFIIAFSGCQADISFLQSKRIKVKEIGFTTDYVFNNNAKPKYYYKMNNGIIMFSDTLYLMSDEFQVVKIKE